MHDTLLQITDAIHKYSKQSLIHIGKSHMHKTRAVVLGHFCFTCASLGIVD